MYTNYVKLTEAVPQHARAELGDHQLTGAFTPFETSLGYINGLNIPITVVLRSGLQITLPPTTVGGYRDFIVRHRVVTTREVKVNTVALSNNTSVESQLIRETIEKGETRYQQGQRIIELKYAVSRDELLGSGGSLYLTNLDIVITTLRDHAIPFHPHSEAGIRNRMIEENEHINTVGSFGYTIEIIDNTGVFGDRFVNVNNEVFKIHVRKDPNRPSGVYRVSSGPVKGDVDFAPPKSEYYTFDEIPTTLGLYKSYEEALTLGDVFAARKVELDELAISIKREEAELKAEKQRREAAFDRLKHELEEERLRQEDERKRKEAEFKATESRFLERQARLKEEIAELEHRRQMESIHRKDHYEEKSYQRKDSSDLLKYIPAVVAAVAAIFVAVRK